MTARPHRDRNAQDFGLKSQDRAVNSYQNHKGVERKCLALGGVVTNATIDGPAAFGGPQRSGALPHHSKADEKDKMEVQFAFLALAFFAAFMAARSLTAYFKQK